MSKAAPEPTGTASPHAAAQHSGSDGTSRQPQGIEVDGARPAVLRVTSLPYGFRLTAAERLILLALACDSFEGYKSAPGYAALAQWTGLSQGVLVKSLRSLCAANPLRPALLVRVSSGGRNVTEWRFQLQPVDNSGEPVRNADEMRDAGLVSDLVSDLVSEPVSNADDSLPSPYPDGDSFLQTPVLKAREVVEEEKPKPVSVADRMPGIPAEPHPYEPNACAAIARICRDRRLPFRAEELLAAAYSLGRGNPWDGYTVVRDAFERSFDDVTDPRAVLMKRLRDAGLADPTVLAQLARRAA